MVMIGYQIQMFLQELIIYMLMKMFGLAMVHSDTQTVN